MEFSGVTKFAEEHKNAFGPLVVGYYDSYCGEPISWGFYIKSEKLTDEEFSAIQKRFSLERRNGQFFVIAKVLDRKEAIEKYGPVTDEQKGPKGGFVSITFGDKKFISRTVAKEC